MSDEYDKLGQEPTEEDVAMMMGLTKALLVICDNARNTGMIPPDIVNSIVEAISFIVLFSYDDEDVDEVVKSCHEVLDYTVKTLRKERPMIEEMMDKIYGPEKEATELDPNLN